MTDREWTAAVTPIVKKCRLAVLLNMNASFNEVGATALADLLEKMAALIDDEIVRREKAEDQSR